METHNKKLKMEKDINYLDLEGPTLLWLMVKQNRIDIIKLLIKNRENFLIDTSGYSLKYNHVSGGEEVANHLLGSPCDFAKYDISKEVTDYIKFKILKEKIANKEFSKALSLATEIVFVDSSKAFDYVLKNLRNEFASYEENTPLNQALFDNNEEIAVLLIEAGANPNIPIGIAANPNIPIEEGPSCLFYAIYHQNKRLVHLLLKSGVKIDENCDKLAKEIHTNRKSLYSDHKNAIYSRDNMQYISKLLIYYQTIREKLRLLALFREFGEDNVFSNDYLPRDMFRVIIGYLFDPDDEMLIIPTNSFNWNLLAFYLLYVHH